MSQRPPTASPVDEVVEFFVRAPSREEIAAFRLSESAQKYIRTLLNKNASGTLTQEENHELDKIMVLNDVISLIRARARGVPAHHDPSDQALVSSALPDA